MAHFIITTDSSCDLPQSYLEKLDVAVIKMKHTENGETFFDAMDDTRLTSFYNSMRNDVIMKTSQINPDEYITFFNEQLKKGLPIIHLSLGSGISGTFSSCTTAVSMINEENSKAHIYPIDTTVGSLGLFILLKKAIELRDNDCPAKLCCKELERIKRNVNVYMTTDDLKYLYRGGRLSKMGVVFGTALKINPIIELTNEGKLTVAHKVRGKNATLEKIAAIVKERVVNAHEQTLFISHADNFEGAKMLAEAIKKTCRFKEVFYSYIGETLGSHAGPGMLTLYFLGKART